MAQWKQSGELPRKLREAPKMPPNCSQLWDDFIELHENRRVEFHGPAPITFRDIKDWQEFYGVELAAWQVEAIRKADNAYFQVRRDAQ